MDLIATFYTHFGAMSFHRRLKREGLADAEMMPVPRALSASCGVCVRYQADAPGESHKSAEDLERIYTACGSEYRLVFEADN